MVWISLSITIASPINVRLILIIKRKNTLQNVIPNLGRLTILSISSARPRVLNYSLCIIYFLYRFLLWIRKLKIKKTYSQDREIVCNVFDYTPLCYYRNNCGFFSKISIILCTIIEGKETRTPHEDLWKKKE